MREKKSTAPAQEGRAAALAAFDRSEDAAELAELAFPGGPPREPTRADDDTVLGEMRFVRGDVVLEVWLHGRGRLRSVTGLVQGDFDHALLETRRPDRSCDAVASVGEDGRFALRDLARGPLSLALRRSGRAPLVTEWFTL
ncbi:hypothetical protein [Nocardiopsis algeriensis]|uniref:Uncharacterized protein n=1 Tax=Nocardiopsis algeriensis TaxID=1478215 RepID=A0A841IM49_9ACTN|nr:hypothetical protein [Nocardiopsis algeriensis]MBB6119132.1 hypothetical protein [Nocardiopsis algeriensis]